jgi:chitin synthase
MDGVLAGLSAHDRTVNKACLANRYHYEETEFEKMARCTARSYLLVVFSALIAATILMKCECVSAICIHLLIRTLVLAVLQLTSKRTPELLDKSIICQGPCYTEGQESHRRTINSLAVLKCTYLRPLGRG